MNNIQEYQAMGAIITVNTNCLRIEDAKFYVDKVEESINNLNTNMIDDDQVEQLSTQNGSASDIMQSVHCVLCYDDVVSKKTLKCGCIYCTECFRQMIISVSRTEQDCINCIGCQVPVDLGDVGSEFTQEEFKTFCKLALNKYMARNLDKYQYCPTSDCDMIYYDDGNIWWRCDNCNIIYCKKCQIIYDAPKQYYDHTFNTCSKIQELKNRPKEEFAEEKSDDWIRNNTRSCPRCNVNIEKNFGCLHMKCRQCGVDYCWVCSRIYGVQVNCTSFKCGMNQEIYNPTG